MDDYYLNVSCHLNRSNEQYIVGGMYVFISTLFLFPYSLCMFLILTNKQMMSKPFYIILLHMGTADMIQLVFNGVMGGVFTITCLSAQPMVNKVVGGTMNFCWVTYCLMAHLLAVNRFVSICYPHKLWHIFSKKNTKIMIYFVWGQGFLWFLVYLTPDVNVLYNVNEYRWEYDGTALSRIVWKFELAIDSFHALGMVFWYACIFLKIKKKLSQIETSSIANRERKKEMIILYQAMLLCSLVILTCVGFFGIPAMTGFFGIPAMTDNRWANLSGTLIWIHCAGLNSLIYVTFNSELRLEMIQLLKVRKAPRTPL
uniref:G-protein coupled receptors family 1 profile domain-containing protein n=1 Tax=Romanomermis culicivorax TaxID=13658 RepID=A0A915JW63_ROMCU